MEKILIIHNNYQDIGGEDIAVENEIKLLSKYFDVRVIYFSNNINNFIKQFFYFLINRNLESEKLLEKEISEFNPDFAYVHNTWFKASNGIFNVLKSKNIKTIVKLHNFRYDCTRSYFVYKHLNKKGICPKCGLNRKYFQIFNKYFKESYLKSFLVIYYGKKYFQILIKSNFKILVLTKFHKSFLRSIGFNDNRIFVYPNFLNYKTPSFENRITNQFVYAGRISKEKGIEELIKTFLSIENKDFTLKIVGNGPDLDFYKKTYKEERIKFMGEMNNDEVLDLIYKSHMVISATKLYEGQPTLLCEASALGVPSIFPLTGGIDEFFPKDYKFSFKQYDYDDLKKKIILSLDNKQVLKIGLEANKYIKDNLNEELQIKKIVKILNE